MLSVYPPLDLIALRLHFIRTMVATAAVLSTIVVIVFSVAALIAVLRAILKAFGVKNEPPKAEENVEGESVEITLEHLIIDKDLRDRLEVFCDTTSEEDRINLKDSGYQTPQGYLLYGPPGTGKTRIARAICGEAKARFFSVSGSDLYGKFSGSGPELINKLFEMARKSPRAIIFIDEIDAIGGKRYDDSTSVGKEYSLVLNALLTNMSNLPPHVKVIAATNRLTSLDPALIRPGRFTEHVYVPLPDEETRKKILDYYMEGVLTADNLDLQKIAEVTEGFSGADLEYLVNEAKYYAMQRNKETVNKPGEKCEIIITNDDLRKAFEKLKAQKEKSAKTNVTQVNANEPSTAEMVEGENVDITLKDIIISDKIREELKAIYGCEKDALRNDVSQGFKHKSPTGYLFYGPPGTGKTALAEAIANEAKIPFIKISASELVGEYVGEGIYYVQRCFEAARKSAPCILFLDEIDSIAARRNSDFSSVSESHNKTLNQFLTEVDKCVKTKGMVVIAATNRPDVLDPAVTRSGRFSKKLEIGLPDQDMRKKILTVYLTGVSGADNLDLEQLAERTEGFSGADLEFLVNEANGNAIDRITHELRLSENCERKITMEDFNDPLEKLKAQKAESAKTNVPKTQMNLTDLLEYLSRMPVAQCENHSDSMRLI